MNRVLSLFQKVAQYPFGKHFFTYQVTNKAPYFKSIRPLIQEIRPHFCQVEMRLRKRVTNHIGTGHAIAMCNMCELAMGMAAEASIPNHRRWIPMGMQVNYVKKATTDLMATCDLSTANWNDSEVPCFVSVKNTEGIEVMNATITLKVTDKPDR